MMRSARQFIVLLAWVVATSLTAPGQTSDPLEAVCEASRNLAAYSATIRMTQHQAGSQSVIEFVGHLLTHSPQSLHFSGLILARLSWRTGASNGHVFTQVPHAIQPVRQRSRVTAPLSFEWHVTSTCIDPGSTSITLVGHTVSHFLHPVHLLRSTDGRWSPVILIASKGHARMHVP